MTTLLLALRHDDHRVARELLDDRDLDVNRESLLESATAAPHEQPTYPTTALVEACRCGDERILRLLLARDDLNVNQLTTKLKCTALADACARGDAASVHILLDDPRTDATLSDTVVAHPALYACMNGSVGVMEALSSRGLLTDALEDSLLTTAVANEQAQVVDFLEQYFISVRPLDVLNRHQQERKVRLVCSKHELGHIGHVPSTALASICEDLGVTLSPEELREAFSVLRVGGKVADDGRVLLRIDDLVAMWLLD